MDRSGRAAYWLQLALGGGIVAAAWIFFSFGPPIALVALLVGMPRLHDIGRSGWWSAIFVIPAFVLQLLLSMEADVLFAGSTAVELVLAVLVAGMLAVLGALPGQPGANKFGTPSR